MTYTVSSGTLNRSIPYHIWHIGCVFHHQPMFGWLTRLRPSCHMWMLNKQLGQPQPAFSNRSKTPVAGVVSNSKQTSLFFFSSTFLATFQSYLQTDTIYNASNNKKYIRDSKYWVNYAKCVALDGLIVRPFNDLRNDRKPTYPCMGCCTMRLNE